MDEIISLVEKHERWRFQYCINLIPSENVMSPVVRSLLCSDLGQRYTSRDQFYMGTCFIDEIEQYGEKLAKEVFNSQTADLRALSGHIADLIFLGCFARSKDTLLCVSSDDGGYPGIQKEGAPSFLKLRVINFPFSTTRMNIDVDEASNLMLKVKPKIVVFGASRILFPHPLRELAKVAREIEAHVGFDGSHILGLIAGGQFQDPLREGASVLFGSTHKSFFGPQGGIIVADEEYGEVIKSKTFPAFVDNAHWNRIAALTLALTEMKKFGKAYARQVVRNAQELAGELAERSFPVACSELGFTSSHQVFLDYSDYKYGKKCIKVARRLEKANIIVDCGIRVGVCEATRRGMKQNEMAQIAEYMKRVAIDKEQPIRVKDDVVKFMTEFQKIDYCLK
jgi:glycine hydroxymethyltransferase